MALSYWLAAFVGFELAGFFLFAVNIATAIPENRFSHLRVTSRQ